MRCYLIFLILLSFFSLKGQENRIKFSRISVEEGLSQSSAFAIAYDSLGYIWIGTYDGLNRYSGYDIKTYRHDTKDSLSLLDNYIQALCVDKNGHLWIGTNSKGICIFSHALEKFERIPMKSTKHPNGLKGYTILTLKQINSATIVALTDEGINKIDIVSKQCELISQSEYDLLEDHPSLTSYFNKETKGKAVTNCYLNDTKGDQWIGADNGLLRKKKGNNDWVIYKNEIFDPNSLSADEITSIMEDKGGVIWVGTSLGGICKWDRLNEGILLYRNNPVFENSLSHSKVRSFYEDSKNRVWVGTVAGGLNLWDRDTDTFMHWNTSSNVGLKSNHIRDVIEWQGNFIIATDGAGLQSFNPDKSPIIFTDFPVKGMEATASVWDIHANNDELWIATNDQGLFLYKSDTVIHYENEIETEKTTWVTTDKDNNVWIGTFGKGLYCKTSNGFKNWDTENSNISDDRIYSIIVDKDCLWLGTKGGVNHLDIESNKFSTYSIIDGLPNETVMGIIPDKNYGLWITTNRGICHLKLTEKKVTNYDINDGLQNNEFLVHSFLKLSTGEFLFGGINGFNVISEDELTTNPYPPQIVLTHFSVGTSDWFSDTSINELRTIELSHHQNEFTFEFAALGYAGVENNTYSYKMEGFDKDWKMSGKRRFAQYTNLPNGKYIFKVKAANNDGVWNGKPATIRLIIHPAFWQTIWFKIVIVISISLLLFTVYRMRIRQMKKRNEILEKEVKERTKEVVLQKEEIEEKNHMIREALNDIHDSIQYAKRIQHAILPPRSLIKEYLQNSFVLFTPKDIVAGDFYWMEAISSLEGGGKVGNNHSSNSPQAKGLVLFAAADCTGHGVPGAMVSVVCNNALNRSVREYGLTKPGLILDKAREIVIQEFEKSEEEVKDGMDIALCSLTFDIQGLNTEENSLALNPKTGAKLQYAGAHNPLWIVRNGELLETKADKQPIGKFDHITPFTTHEIELQKGDTLYIFSDGYADQFGGEKGKKFKSKAFKNLLLLINHLPMEEQKEQVKTAFENWKGNLEQLDDVCVIGVKI